MAGGTHLGNLTPPESSFETHKKLTLPRGTTGWWLSHPSEKYESQLGWLFPIYGKIKMFQTTNQTIIWICHDLSQDGIPKCQWIMTNLHIFARWKLPSFFLTRCHYHGVFKQKDPNICGLWQWHFRLRFIPCKKASLELSGLWQIYPTFPN